MTREEKQKAIDVLKISAPLMAMTQGEFDDYIKIINQVMDWLEQEPCDDAISRDAVLEIICRETEWYDIRTQIEQLPSVTQPGKWIDINGIYAECSNCNEEIYITGDFKFCPNCGAKMESEE